MIFSAVKIPRGLFRAAGVLLVLLCCSPPSKLRAGQNWSAFANATMNSGHYIYTENTRNYYLTSGVRWRGHRFSFTASLPLIWQENPTSETGDDLQQPVSESMHGPGSFSMGVGDIYLYSTYRLTPENSKFARVALTAQVKIPTGDEITFFSTGAADYGLGFTLSKRFGAVNFFADAGYLKLGDTAAFNYSDPLTFGVGLGRWFKNGEYSASLYVKNYTEIIPGFDPPGQVSLGLYKQFAVNQLFSVYLGRGFSESSPDITISG